MDATNKTELEMIDTGEVKFTWGRVLRVHKFGKYGIVEYVDKLGGGLKYHACVNGKSTHNSYMSFDESVIGCVAHGNLEANEARYMAVAASKVLGIG